MFRLTAADLDRMTRGPARDAAKAALVAGDYDAVARILSEAMGAPAAIRGHEPAGMPAEATEEPAADSGVLEATAPPGDAPAAAVDGLPPRRTERRAAPGRILALAAAGVILAVGAGLAVAVAVATTPPRGVDIPAVRGGPVVAAAPAATQAPVAPAAPAAAPVPAVPQASAPAPVRQTQAPAPQPTPAAVPTPAIVPAAPAYSPPPGPQAKLTATLTLPPGWTPPTAPVASGVQAGLPSTPPTPAGVTSTTGATAPATTPAAGVMHCTIRDGQPCWDAVTSIWWCPNEVDGSTHPCSPAELHVLQSGLPWYVKAQDCVAGAGCQFGTKYTG